MGSSSIGTIARRSLWVARTPFTQEITACRRAAVRRRVLDAEDDEVVAVCAEQLKGVVIVDAEVVSVVVAATDGEGTEAIDAELGVVDAGRRRLIGMIDFADAGDATGVARGELVDVHRRRLGFDLCVHGPDGVGMFVAPRDRVQRWIVRDFDAERAAEGEELRVADGLHMGPFILEAHRQDARRSTPSTEPTSSQAAPSSARVRKWHRPRDGGASHATGLRGRLKPSMSRRTVCSRYSAGRIQRAIRENR